MKDRADVLRGDDQRDDLRGDPREDRGDDLRDDTPKSDNRISDSPVSDNRVSDNRVSDNRVSDNRISGPGDDRRPWPTLLLNTYPPDWRARYGDELELLITDLRAGGRAPLPMAFDLLCGAAAAWLTFERRTLMSERSRNALISVLWSWVAFAAVAAWFGHDLAIYPTAAQAQQIGISHPAVPDAYHVLYAAGAV